MDEKFWLKMMIIRMLWCLISYKFFTIFLQFRKIEFSNCDLHNHPGDRFFIVKIAKSHFKLLKSFKDFRISNGPNLWTQFHEHNVQQIVANNVFYLKKSSF